PVRGRAGRRRSGRVQRPGDRHVPRARVSGSAPVSSRGRRGVRDVRPRIRWAAVALADRCPLTRPARAHAMGGALTMAKKARIRWDLNRKGVAQLLRSPGVKRDLQSRANRIALAAGEGVKGYVWDGFDRSRARVVT